MGLRRFLRGLLPVVLTCLVACTNYQFRTDAGGRVDVAELIRDLETRQSDEPQFLQQTTWVPFIFHRIRRFHRTEKTLEPNMPFGGYTFAEHRSAGPLGLFWLREDVIHHDVDGEVFHREGRGGVGQRLVAWYDHEVTTGNGVFVYQRVEILFGLLKTEKQGYPARIDRYYPPKAPRVDRAVPEAPPAASDVTPGGQSARTEAVPAGPRTTRPAGSSGAREVGPDPGPPGAE